MNRLSPPPTPTPTSPDSSTLSPSLSPKYYGVNPSEINRLCNKLKSKDLGKQLKRLHEPNVLLPKTKEQRETAQSVLEVTMSLLLKAPSRDTDTLLEVLPSFILSHGAFRDEVFSHVLGGSNTNHHHHHNNNKSLADLLNTTGTNNVLRESIFLTFEERPSVVYQKFSEYIDRSGPTRSAALLLLGRMMLKYRRHARRITETGAWPALISVLRTERDPAVMTIALWVIVLLLPHVAGVLPEVLIDVLYILKRCLTSFGRVVQGGRSSSTLGEHSLTSPSSSSPSLSSPSTPASEFNTYGAHNGTHNSTAHSTTRNTSKEITPPFSNATTPTATMSPTSTTATSPASASISTLSPINVRTSNIMSPLSPTSPKSNQTQSPVNGIMSSPRNSGDSSGASAEELAVAAAMEPYVSSLFRFMYALFPHETLTFLQAECSANVHLTSILERRLHWMRFHPALLQPQSNETNIKKWLSHSPEELLGFADELAIRSSSLLSEFKPLVSNKSKETTSKESSNHLRGASLTSIASVASVASVASIGSDASLTSLSSDEIVEAVDAVEGISLSTLAPVVNITVHPLPVPLPVPVSFPVENVEIRKSNVDSIESTSIPIGSLTTKAGSFNEPRRSAFTSVGSGSSGSSGNGSLTGSPNGKNGNRMYGTSKLTRSTVHRIPTVVIKHPPAPATSSTIASIAAFPESAAGLFTPPKIDRIATAISPTVLTDHLVELQRRQSKNVQQGDVVLLSNELLYERYLREQQEWKLRSMRRRMHSQSVQVKESSILRKQLRAQMRITGDLQAAIAKEREQAKGYKQGHKKWSADMRIKVMRQREEYLQVVERNVELQNSVNHLNETITQLEGNLSATHTQLFQLNGVRNLYDQASKGRSDAEQRIAQLRKEHYELQQLHRSRIYTTVSEAIKCRDQIIAKLSIDLEKSLDILQKKKQLKQSKQLEQGPDQKENETTMSGMPRWLQAARSAQQVGSLYGDQSIATNSTNPLNQTEETVSSYNRVRDQMGIPNIIVRLQKLIIESLETQRNNGIGSNPKIPSLQQLKTQLIDEFGAPMYHGYLAKLESEMAVAISVDPSLYSLTKFHIETKNENNTRRDGSDGSGESGGSSGGAHAILQTTDTELKKSQEIELSIERAASNDIIDALTAKMNKLDELLSKTRESAKTRSQGLERRCMSMRQVNVALERRLMLAMQENENMKLDAESSANSEPLERAEGEQTESSDRSTTTPRRGSKSSLIQSNRKSSSKGSSSVIANTKDSKIHRTSSPPPRLFGRASNLSQWALSSPKRSRNGNGNGNVSPVRNGRNSISASRNGSPLKKNVVANNVNGSSDAGVVKTDPLSRRMSDIITRNLNR